MAKIDRNWLAKWFEDMGARVYREPGDVTVRRVYVVGDGREESTVGAEAIVGSVDLNVLLMDIQDRLSEPGEH